MKMQKGKMIVTLAVASALGLGAQVWAQDSEPLEVEVDITKTVDVTKNSNNTLEVDASKKFEISKEVEVTKDSYNTLEVDASKKFEVSKEVEVTKNDDSYNTLEVDASKKIEVSKEVEVTKNDDSYNTLKVDASKKFELEVTKNEAEEGSVAAIGGDASKEEVDGSIENVAGGSIAATTGATASLTDSNNTDNSINISAEKGGIAGNSAPVDVTEESYNNKATDHSAAIYGNGDATVNENVGNTTNSNNLTSSVTVGDVDVEIAASVLSGEVSNNSNTANLPLDTTGANTMTDSLTTPSGIAVVSQNSGFNALVQQSVNVQVNQ